MSDRGIPPIPPSRPLGLIQLSSLNDRRVNIREIYSGDGEEECEKFDVNAVGQLRPYILQTQAIFWYRARETNEKTHRDIASAYCSRTKCLVPIVLHWQRNWQDSPVLQKETQGETSELVSRSAILTNSHEHRHPSFWVPDVMLTSITRANLALVFILVSGHWHYELEILKIPSGYSPQSLASTHRYQGECQDQSNIRYYGI